MIAPFTIVFDLGKVLVDFDYQIAARKIAASGKASIEQVQKFLDHSPLLFRYETGRMTREEFYREVCAGTGFCGGIEEFAEFFADIFTPIEPMIDLHAALRKSGLPTYIFSNTNDIAVAHIRRRFPFFSNFDGYILSSQQGVMKPEPQIYEAVEKLCGRRGAEILYLDDRPENIAGGVARGWQTILHETPEKTISAIVKLGLVRERALKR